MKKSLIITSLLGITGSAFAQTTRVQKIYLDSTSVNFEATVNKFRHLNEANILQPTNTGWKINKDAFKNKDLNMQFEVQTLREILGPGIDIEHVDAIDLVLASQDVRARN